MISRALQVISIVPVLCLYAGGFLCFILCYMVQVEKNFFHMLVSLPLTPFACSAVTLGASRRSMYLRPDR